MNIWDKLTDRFLQHLMRKGSFAVVYFDGTRKVYGDGTGQMVELTLKTPEISRKILRNPDVGVGEGYMDGELTIKDDDLPGFMALAMINMQSNGLPWFEKPLKALRYVSRRMSQFNPRSRAAKNVESHYDLSGALYDLFLDADRQYSCAYFEHPGMTLEEAQEAKKAHIAKKLLIKPGMTVLDIGCGWGGMALTLARDYGARVVGVTLSHEQHAVARQRVRDAGLEDRIDIRLCDYRSIQENFDRIVSVGMFEHVGAPHFREYFRHVNKMLKPQGVALIHFIGRISPPGTTSDWILKYIFPGGYCPAMSETSAAVEKEDLVIADLEVWRIHYADTLREWLNRFEARIDEARALYDERFTRMWRFYLLASEMSFRHAGLVVFQYQLCHDVNDVPVTRNYLYDEPADHRPRLAAE